MIQNTSEFICVLRGMEGRDDQVDSIAWYLSSQHGFTAITGKSTRDQPLIVVCPSAIELGALAKPSKDKVIAVISKGDRYAKSLTANLKAAGAGHVINMVLLTSHLSIALTLVTYGAYASLP